jgi:hypothetical protein
MQCSYYCLITVLLVNVEDSCVCPTAHVGEASLTPAGSRPLRWQPNLEHTGSRAAAREVDNMPCEGNRPVMGEGPCTPAIRNPHRLTPQTPDADGSNRTGEHSAVSSEAISQEYICPHGAGSPRCICAYGSGVRSPTIRYRGS